MTDDSSLHPDAPAAKPGTHTAAEPPEPGEPAAAIPPQPAADAQAAEPREPAAARGPAAETEPAGAEAPAEGPPGRVAQDGGRQMPEYKGGDLDPARGPGLGCFWFQAAVLIFFLVLIPVGISLSWPYELLAVLLFVVIFLLLFVGQTVIFLLRLVAADRRNAGGRRRPLASASRTVGELEDVQAPLGTTVARTVDDVEAERIAHAAAIRATAAGRTAPDPAPGRRVVAPAPTGDVLPSAADRVAPGDNADGAGGSAAPGDDPDGAAGSRAPGMRQ